MENKITLRNSANEEIYISDSCVMNEDGTTLDSTLNDLNMTAEEVVDNTNFPDIDILTREQLKKDLFVDLWNDACKFDKEYGKYDPNNAPDSEHPFYLNELWLTYEEAIAIYNAAPKDCGHGSATSAYQLGYAYGYYPFAKCRTLIPPRNTYRDASINCYRNQAWAEVLYGIPTTQNPLAAGTFYNCRSLRKIIKSLYVNSNLNYEVFYNCTALEDLKLQVTGNCTSLNLQYSPKLSYDSMSYLVSTSNSAQCEVKVHPDVYSALTGQADYPFNGGTQEQWEQLMTDAINKNITFASA